jgi:hypothetical protein
LRRRSPSSRPRATLPGSPSRRAAAMLAAMAACAWAAAGDPRRCDRALGDAEAALSRVSLDDDEPAWFGLRRGRAVGSRRPRPPAKSQEAGHQAGFGPPHGPAADGSSLMISRQICSSSPSPATGTGRASRSYNGRMNRSQGSRVADEKAR